MAAPTRAASTALRQALFLDRDGTIITDEHFLNDAERVRLVPGAASWIARANRAGILVVIVTNQSGIGRGIISQDQYDAVAERVIELLSDEGALIDATYYCADHPDVAADVTCRKPAMQMYWTAARELGIDLARSAYMGDKWRDVQPALTAGGLGILIPNHETDQADIDRAMLTAHTAADVGQAISHALVWMGVVE
ncbi:MAG: D-glycero-alpha-D-manno-heptose-1,7-bisphosphate 7-phosphatase [Gemmatimonas sp.]